MENAASANGYISERIPVPPEWDEVFAPFYYALNKQQVSLRKKLLPTFQTILVFNFGAPILLYPDGDDKVLTLNKTVVLGPLKKAFEYELPPGGEMLVANFKWDAFYRFFGTALQPYHDHLQHPDALLQRKHCFSGLWEALKVLPQMEQRVEKVLDFAGVYLRQREAASEALIDNNSSTDVLSPVKTIAGKKGQTERNIQLNYKKYLGFSAKEMSRYQRFQQAAALALQLFESRGAVDWFEVIYQCGYYDQSHLIHDFKHFLDLTPAQFIKFQSDICIAGS